MLARKKFWSPSALFTALAPALALSLAGCADAKRPNYLNGDAGTGVIPVTETCLTPNEGCACPDEGSSVDCGRVSESYADYVTCSLGTRTCTDGKWAECIGERQVQKALASSSAGPGSHLEALGGAGAACPAGFDPCDPFCNRVIDTPGGFDAGAGFDNTTTQLQLKKVPFIGCTSMTVTVGAPGSTQTVSGFSPFAVTPAALTLTAAVFPAGCLVAPFNTTWTIDRFDVAKITGTNNTNGSFTALSSFAGDVVVTAYAAGRSAATTFHVKVNVLDAPTTTALAAPNTPASAAQISAFGTYAAPLPGTLAESSTWLYPYSNTFFPLGLPAPVMQYLYTSGTGSAVKISLRFPSNATIAASLFNYSLIVKESNTISQASVATGGAALAANTTDPQVLIPQTAWQAFEQAARSIDPLVTADIIVQRYRSTGTLELAASPTVIHFANSQLKGSVFYNSYSSQIGTGNTGAVLKINPGATAPTLAIQPSNKCNVCHTVSLDGSKIIAAGGRPVGGVAFDNARRFDMTSGTLPSPTVLNSYDSSTGTDTANVQGNRFNFAAVYPDGTLYMTEGANPSTGGTPAPNGENNWHAPIEWSLLQNPNAPSTAGITVTGWANMSAVTPRFSIDGTKLAFGFWGGSTTKLPCAPSGSGACVATGLPSVAAGTRLTAVDFSCTTPPCSVSSAGFKVLNARDLTPGVTRKVAWPTFTPDGGAVAYQMQYRSARTLLTGWSPSDINTIGGSMAEIWLSKVPATSATAAVPIELRALNGLPATGTTSYLPTNSPYHLVNGSFAFTQADNCSATVAAASNTNVNDYQLNYLPAFSPNTTSELNWVVFTSRRMYGNIADDDPWDAEPGPTACGGGSCTCSSHTPPTKKLWIAAIDKTIGTTDPSHPAFYLPGQELMAGNSDGTWVNSPCVALNVACDTNDDCCGGTGTTPTTRCDGVTETCKLITACLPASSTCTSTADCCTGLVCAGTGKCETPNYYSVQTFARDFLSSCAVGKRPVWRFLECQSTIPAGTSITLAIQTSELAAGPFLPVTPLTAATITTTTAAGIWAHGTSTADQILTSGGVQSLPYLRVLMTFTPDSGGVATPSLANWRQNYDCVDAE